MFFHDTQTRRLSWLLIASVLGAVITILSAVHGVYAQTDEGRGAWTDAAPLPAQAAGALAGPAGGAEDGGARQLLPQRYRLLTLDTNALLAALPAPGGGPGAEAPGEAGTDVHVRAAAPAAVLALPMPEGGFQRFAIEYAPVDAAQAAAADAVQTGAGQALTYRGRGIDDPMASLRLGLTAQGLHAIILGEQHTTYITHLAQLADAGAGAGNETLASSSRYASYHARAYQEQEAFVCGVDASEHAIEASYAGAAGVRSDMQRNASGELRAEGAPATGADVQSYRLAVAVTGEYAAAAIAHAGLANATEAEKRAAVRGAIIAQVNMINAIYEREAAIHFDLVANNDALIYLDALADPYTNDRLDLMLAENRRNLDAVLGSAGYDIGHVLGTSGGGVAYIGVACNSNYKGGGASGPGAAATPYSVMVIAHEIGHQLGATHTHNANSWACGGANRSASSAVEPGSGSTIMSYSGLCGADQNLQGYLTEFHVVSFAQMYGYSRAQTGAQCGAAVVTGNLPPVVTAGPDHTVPARTPLLLKGTATDPEGQPLTFSWQQVDVPAAPLTGTATLTQALTDVGSGPLYRVYESDRNGSVRALPAPAHVLGGSAELGEVLPTTSRNLNFQLFVHDNAPLGGGASYDDVRLTVINTGAPFSVTAPSGGTVWPGGLRRSVAWDVAGTAAPPIACEMVELRLSSDNGVTYPQVLAAATANDGEELVTLPPGPVPHARIRAGCTDNVFYNVSGPFSIQGVGPAGVLAGVVRDTAGAPAPGVRVEARGPDTAAANTGADGTYAIQLPAGTYTVSAAAYGYVGVDLGGVPIAEGVTKTLDMVIEPLPLHTIQGHLTDAGHGYGLYATLSFAPGLPTVWTDPRTGHYTVTVLYGYVYTVTAAAWAPGFAAYEQVWEPVAGTEVLNIALGPDPQSCAAPGYRLEAGACVPIPGGLVTGRTYGRNGEALTGVTVARDQGMQDAVASAWTSDPAAPGAFYSLFLPVGTQVVTATAPGLPAIAATIAMRDEGVVLQDFDWQAAYADAALRTLAPAGGQLVPAFDPEIGEYSVVVDYAVSRVEIGFAARQAEAAVRYNGAALPPGAAAVTAELAPGRNVLTFDVRALDGVTQRTYTVTIVRAAWPAALYLPQLQR
jgi:hypothetical protein